MIFLIKILISNFTSSPKKGGTALKSYWYKDEKITKNYIVYFDCSSSNKATMKGGIVFVILCVKIAFIAADSFESSTTNIALSVYGECSNAEDLYVCLKKKAFTLLDRLGRSQNLSISDSVKLVRPASSVPVQEEEISEKKLDELLPRSLDAKNAALTRMLSSKIAEFFGSRTLEISLPRYLSDDDDSDDDDDVTDEGNELLVY